MANIQVLDFAVANLIAAGEVVDRPASVIKELMENAIDAGARHVTVEIQNGGVTFMRVSDDGCGMEQDDLPVAVRRHATSKIRSAEDLERIATLGFRGEALAAIASVSELRIMSKRREDVMGSVLEAKAGNIVRLAETGCPDGTTVIVEALFANVPARRKFLKRDATEAQAVSQAVERVALSHPEIAFKLIIDGDMKLNTAGDGKLHSAVWAVFGRDFATRLIPLKGEYEGIEVSGFIGRSDNVKGTRNYQNFFINGRWIKSKTAMAALEQAFASYLAPEKYPACVMTLTIDPARVDVNVHPAKLEVKFSNEKLVFEAIYYAVKQALEQDVSRPEVKLPGGQGKAADKPQTRRMSDAFAPVSDGRRQDESLARRQLSMAAPPPTPAASVKAASSAARGEPFARLTAEEYVKTYLGGKGASPAKAPAKAVPTMPTPAPAPVAEPKDIPLPSDADVPPLPPAEEKTSPVAEQTPVPAPKTPAALPTYRIVGEVFHAYVLVEVEDKLLIIDKHAAHERVLFEQLKAKLHAAEQTSQLLMLPTEVMLMSDEVATLEEYRPELEAIGFAFSAARNTVSVSALPTGLDSAAAGDMLAAIADRIKSDTGTAALTRDLLFEKALYQGACKAAIKAGRAYAEGHTQWLVDQLMAIPNITACPHGRPVAMEMSHHNLDHQFERN